ncbi:MAG: putative porin [Oleiphilaceae bacterium]|jgi:predicted porin
MTFNKKLLVGLVALAAASSAQAVTVAANDGWTLGVSGSVNQFMTYTSNDATGGNDEANLQNGLLPAFLSFDMTAPTMNGLDIAAHISISPSTNVDSYSGMEQREVYFTVAGGFGQILAGKALGLYASHNILTDQTLFGVGYGTGTASGTTTLGGISLGYDYASWRSQVKWTSNDMNGFKLAIAVMDPSTGAQSVLAANGNKPTGSLTTGGTSSDNFRYEADLSYAGAFDGGSFTAWVSGMTQQEDNSNDNDQDAYTVGGTLKVGGFETMAQYSDASDQDNGVVETEWNQYLVQAGYRFAGTTLVSAQYAELTDDTSTTLTNDSIDKMTVGVYHDVNANLKLVAEYTKVEDDDSNVVDTDIISLGGFVFF